MHTKYYKADDPGGEKKKSDPPKDSSDLATSAETDSFINYIKDEKAKMDKMTDTKKKDKAKTRINNLIENRIDELNTSKNQIAYSEETDADELKGKIDGLEKEITDINHNIDEMRLEIKKIDGRIEAIRSA